MSIRKIYRNDMGVFISCCWFYFSNCLFFLFNFILQHVFRIKMEDGSQKAREANETEEIDFVRCCEDEEEEEEEPSNFCFKFEYQIPSMSRTKINEEDEKFQEKTTNISNCQFLSDTDFGGFVEESEAQTFQVHESFVASSKVKSGSEFLSATNFQKPVISNYRFSPEKDFSGFVQESEAPTFQVHESFIESNEENLESEFLSDVAVEKPSISNYRFVPEKDFTGFDVESESAAVQEKLESGYLSAADFEKPSISNYQSSPGKEFSGFLDESEVQESFVQGNEELLEFRFFSGNFEKPIHREKEVVESFSGFDSDSDSLSLSDGYSVKDLVIESESDGFLSERDFGGDDESLVCSSAFEVELVQEIENLEEKINELNNLVSVNYSPYTEKLSQLDESWSDNESLEAELKELNAEEIGESELPSSNNVQIELTDSSNDEFSSSKSGETLGEEEKSERIEDKDLDDEDLDELESLWEHQDLIEQLKMELKRVRATGLPTIFEESESPKTIEDLKPWKIDEKFLRGDPMDELHKFYKSYRERMRKFDILNYQKMYAIGFLQLKNPLESMGAQKPLIQMIISHLSRKSSTDPSEKFMKELQVDLETIYVGQMCLSWEFLRWQYEKARELPDSDPYRRHQYNQVAGEFQQFQVIAQRFIENESFQGPRLQNYVKNRCVLRNLLQVPVIKEDCLKDKMEGKRKGNFAVTSEMLEEIMEESIRIFWEFVKADKDETSIILKGLMRNQVELQNPSDFDLLADIQTSLQKKDKKLKDILKTDNCLVKKFKKPREDRSNQDLFFSQVDMKLISRVLKMPYITTDQLVWCHTKLSKITFPDRSTICRDPSFLLFPC